MMDLTKWLPLFEKCPELEVRVGNSRLRPDPEYPDQYCLWLLDDGSTYREAIEVGLALIRDKAVIVGAEKFGIILIFRPRDHHVYGDETNGDYVVIWRHFRLLDAGDPRLAENPDGAVGECQDEIACHSDPTEALYLAVCKVLGMTPAP